MAGRAWSSRPSSRSSGRRCSASDVARRAAASSVSAISRNWAGSSRPPRAARSIAGPMSRAAADPDAGRSARRSAGLVGLVESAGNHDRVVRRLERLGEAPARAEPGESGQPFADGRELEQGDRLGVHHSAGRRPGDGRMAGDREPPGPAQPRLGRVADPDPGGGDDRRGGSPASAGSRCTAEAGSHRSSPVRLTSSPNAAPSRPGPEASRSSATAATRPAIRSRRSGSFRARLTAVSLASRSRRAASTPSVSSTARTSTAAGRRRVR